MGLRRAGPKCALLDVALIAVFTLLVMVLTRTSADPDLWGHLQFGSDLLSTHRLPDRDPYSFTSDRPWINHEWLAELVTAGFYLSAGAVGLNLLKLSVIGLIGLLVWRAASEYGGGVFSNGFLTAFVLLTTYTRTRLLRPQLFSVLFFCVLLVTLLRIEKGKREPVWLIPTFFCVWANMHGGWIVGFGMLTVWTAFEMAQPRLVTERVRRGLVLIAALGATLINPYGVSLWTFLHETVGFSRQYIQDWVPLLALPAGAIAAELLLPAVAVVAAAIQRRVPSWRHITMIGMLGIATYRVGRVDAFLQLAVALLALPIIVEWLNAIEIRLRKAPRLTRVSYAHGAVAAGLIIAAAVGAVTRVDKVYVEGDWRPDAGAAQFVRQGSPNTRLLTWFDWGEYAIWHLSAVGIQVSMDGRRETVYSDRVVHDHFAFYANEPDAWQYPATIGADRIWLPKRLPVVRTLQTRGWHAIYQSAQSVVLARDGDDAPLTSTLGPTRSFFP